METEIVPSSIVEYSPKDIQNYKIQYQNYLGIHKTTNKFDSISKNKSSILENIAVGAIIVVASPFIIPGGISFEIQKFNRKYIDGNPLPPGKTGMSVFIAECFVWPISLPYNLFNTTKGFVTGKTSFKKIQEQRREEKENLEKPKKDHDTFLELRSKYLEYIEEHKDTLSTCSKCNKKHMEKYMFHYVTNYEPKYGYECHDCKLWDI